MPPRIRGWGLIAVALCALLAGAGCQYQVISAVELQIHQSRLDKQGLTPLHVDKDQQVTCAAPDQWDRLPETKNILYSDQEWRSPDRRVGMGVAFMHTPFPLSAKTILWFAKSQYCHDKANSSKGRLIGQWSDSLGRCWFEAENDHYHVRGYAMTRGCDAWVVYSGYRVRTPPLPAELLLAEKAADSVAPLGGGSR